MFVAANSLRRSGFEAIARGAGTIVTFAVGMLTCALVMLVGGVVETQSDTTKVILAVLGTTTAASLTLYFTRGHDAVKDRREVRRKIRGSIIQIQSLASAWRRQHALIRNILQDSDPRFRPLSNRDVALLYAGSETLRQVANIAPTFADILDDEDDFSHANAVRRAFSFTSDYFVVEEVVLRRGKAHVAAEVYATPELLDAAASIMHHLELAEQHYIARLKT